MNRRIVCSLVVAALVGLALTIAHPAVAADDYIITDLGALSPDKPYSGAWQQTINNKGEVAAFANSSADDLWLNAFVGDSPFFWKKGMITALPELPAAVDTVTFHINNLGDMVGRSTQELPFNHAVLWDHGIIHQLPELPGDNRSAALSINDRGQIVGYSRLGGVRRGAYWYRGQVAQLPSLPGGGRYDEGLGINNAGIVVGFSGPAFGLEHIALWDRHGVHDLGTLGGDWGDGYRINEKGQLVGTSAAASGEAHPFLWKHGALTDLGVLSGDNDGIALDINRKGQIVGSSDNINNSDYNTSYHALLWAKGVLIDLNARIPANAGWRLLQAGGINDRGQIVGTGLHNGTLRAFLLTPKRHHGDDDDGDDGND